MPSNAEQSKAKSYEHMQESNLLTYRLGTSPATWPSLIMRTRADIVELYDQSPFNTYTGDTHYYLMIEDNLVKTLAEYHNLPAQDWNRQFIEGVGVGRDIFQVYDLLRKEAKNRLAAKLAKRVLRDPDQVPIPWQQAKAELEL